MYDILNAAQTARVLGCAPEMVRQHIRRKIWTFGVAIPPKQSGKTQYRFEINKKALAEWIGISVEEVDRRVAGK